MSIFSSLQMAGNTLQAMQIGLHVVGNNIANANTPGYVRERAVFAPAPVQKLGNLTLGLGVEVLGIVQQIDKFTESRLRDAAGDRASAEAQDDVYRTLETILSPLNDEASITALTTNFFNAIHDIANDPDVDSIALRDLAIESGKLLTQAVNSLQQRVGTEFQDQDTRVEQIADEINTLTAQISKLNLQIVTIEGGGASDSDAGALRSQRGVALKKLAELADVTINESDTGITNVNINGEILIFEATRRQVEVQQEENNGSVVAEVEFADNGSAFNVGGGELHGVYEARDGILGDFLTGLDDFARALTFEFNKVYSQGQGISGFETLTSTYRTSDPSAALNAAGLTFVPENGKFDLLVYNKTTEESVTHTISVDLNGSDSETSLTSLAAAMDAVDGVSAAVSIDNELVITSDSSDVSFAFEKDTSGILAALGVNTFFTGSSAGSLGVNQLLTTGKSPGSLFAASMNGINGEDTGNALQLIDLQDEELAGLDGSSILGVYDRLVNNVSQGATIAASVADGLRVFEGTLEAGAQGVSGVNLDEEAIDMIQLQRAYQASARYIQTLSELLDVLVNL
ncbi:MAG: flagellar hook-associated protein FlgK [Bythopirellula sp.]